jgi:phosphoribosylaminoimidazole carboxylase (NCAIR synthetase)
MINLIGAIPEVAQIPRWRARPPLPQSSATRRKVGHLTIVARDMATLMRKVEECRSLAGVWLPPNDDAVPPARS